MFLGDRTFNYALWTISYEFYGSLLVFAFLALTFHTRNRAIPLLALLVYFISFSMYYYAAFLMGIALHFSKHWELRNPVWNFLCSGLLLLLALVFGAHPATGNWLPTFTPQPHGGPTELYHMVGSVLLLISILMSPRMQRILSGKLPRFLGYISFCLYLLHPIVIGTFGCFLFLQLFPHLSYMQTVGITYMATIVVAIGAAFVMTRLVDERGVRLSKYVYNRWFHKAAPEQSGAG
jgi:peptidoglycan/LPS O-acetylase OafA/YrhL